MYTYTYTEVCTPGDKLIYVIGESDTGVVKIGHSKNVDKRLRAIQTSYPGCGRRVGDPD